MGRVSGVSDAHLVLAPDVSDLHDVLAHLRYLTEDGETIQVAFRHGSTDDALRALPHLHRLKHGRDTTTARRDRIADRALALRGQDRVEDARWRRLLERDEEFTVLLDSADVLVPVGWGEGSTPIAHLTRTRPELRVATIDDVLAERVETDLRDQLPDLLEGRLGELPEDAVRMLDALALLPSDHSLPADVVALLMTLAEGLSGAGADADALRVVDVVQAHRLALTSEEDAILSAVITALDLSTTATTTADIGRVVGDALGATDAALAAGDLPLAARRLTRTLSVLFHRELHADNETTPLVEDPAGFLAPWRASATHALVSTPAPRASEPAREPGERPRALVLPGSYGRFAAPVVQALRAEADVDVLDLASRPFMTGLGVREELVLARLSEAAGHPLEPDEELRERMAAADVVFVDWADRGSVLATMQVPDGVRLVLRIHSMDALSPWIHLLDWSRIDDLILVSPHLADIVVAQLGERLERTRVHVVPHAVDTTRFVADKDGPHAQRTLAVIGWAQRVKDPLWALEVLARLRQDDPAWRLRLIGTDFMRARARSAQDYALNFRQRLSDEDVVDAVEFVEYTDDVPATLRDVGFIVSASVRESFGLGLVEGAASGSIPVVRDWPLVRRHGGPRTIFPADWVVDDVEAAVARIRAHSSPDDWATGSEDARAKVMELFAHDDTDARYREIVLGR